MRKFYKHLSLDDGKKKISVNEIAIRLGRHRSTIFREMQSNTFLCEKGKTLNGYTHLNTQEFYHHRRQKQQKSANGLKAFIIHKLQSDWSPEHNI